MPVPKEILSVERPKNTIVVAYGKKLDHYAVRERLGCRYVEGRRLPTNGKIVGHIVNGSYVPKEMTGTISPVARAPIDLKDWANVELCNRIAGNLLEELHAVYNGDDSCKIFCCAILRVCFPGIKDNELKSSYDESFLSEIYPNIALSKNTISVLWNNIGHAYSRICKFMEIRVSKVEKNHHIIIDGTLKSNDSKVNTLSDFSRKSKLKNAKDISILYAYDLEAEEPICCKCYPGNMIDATSYENFIDENKIKKGIIVGDKGFPSSCAKKHFAKNLDLHYLNSLKRNSKYIKDFNLLEFTEQVPGHENILFSKVKVAEDKYIYSFKDIHKAYREDCGWLHNASKNSNFENSEYNEDKELFGVIILESDLDLDPKTVYKIYSSRWEIELVMRYYKQTCEFDETRVHDDYSVIGSEFCNFLSTVITYRLINLFDKKDLFEKLTYKKILRVLARAKKVKLEEKNWELIKINPSQEKILQKLELLAENPSTKAEARTERRGAPSV